jgi:hypothetical protein
MPYVTPLLHPSAVLRGRWPEEAAQIAYLQRVVTRIQDHIYPEIIDYNLPPPRGVLFPNLRALDKFKDGLDQIPKPCLSLDIENAGQHLLCIGLWILDLESMELGPGLCLPFRLQGGGNYWSDQDHPKAVEWLYDRLADPKVAKLFHNGVTHDVPMLEDMGFEVGGELLDTMVLAHHLYPEMRKGLQYLATLYLGAGVWKSLTDAKDAEDK